jgi:hypothetical protein
MFLYKNGIFLMQVLYTMFIASIVEGPGSMTSGYLQGPAGTSLDLLELAETCGDHRKPTRSAGTCLKRNCR